MSAGILGGISRPVHACFHSGKLRGLKFPQHVIDQRAGSRPDPEAKARDGLGRQMHQDGLQTVVTPRAAGRAEPELPKRKGGIVQHNENFRGADSVITRIVFDGLSTEIHKGLRLHKQTSAARRNLGIPLRLEAE